VGKWALTVEPISAPVVVYQVFAADPQCPAVTK
jgi:hypothetical protein